LGLEVKVKDGEKLSQYTYYPKILAEQFTVCFCGLIGAREVRKGRRAILEPFLSEAADTRLTWGELIEQLSQQLGEKRVSPLKNALVSLQPDILDGGRFAYDRKQEAKRDIRHLVSNPPTVVAFFNDYVREMGDGFEAEPWQAGNAPTQMLLGRNRWAEWFGDGCPCRLGLSLGIPAPDPYLDFVIILWNKTMCGGTLDIVRLQEASRFFTLKGYKTQRNLPGKWHTTIQSEPPVARETGFFFCNIFDAGKYRLSLAKAEQLGWDKSVRDVAERSKSLVSLLDSLVR
jgi:hypothetical protein